MEIRSVNDVQLAGRALRNGWLDSVPEKRQQVIAEMVRVATESDDEALRIRAFEALVKADAADVKRQEMEIKKQESDERRKQRLLALLERLGPEQIAQLASDHAAIAKSEREG